MAGTIHASLFAIFHASYILIHDGVLYHLVIVAVIIHDLAQTSSQSPCPPGHLRQLWARYLQSTTPEGRLGWETKPPHVDHCRVVSIPPKALSSYDLGIESSLMLIQYLLIFFQMQNKTKNNSKWIKDVCAPKYSQNLH